MHFWHKRICQLANRPFDSVEEMNDALIQNWNDTVGPADIVYQLGDFSFGRREQTETIVKSLNGDIHALRGNHDPDASWFDDLFVTIQDYKELHDGDRKIVLCHYPIESWHKAHKGSWHLHGHCHGGLKRQIGHRLDVGVDSVGYAPINLDQIAQFMAEQPAWAPSDHHV